MIFVCTGTQIYQFNRLLKELDQLIEDNKIKDEVYAQIGSSDYVPKHYKYIRFQSPEEFKQCQDRADLIVSHGGTGALITALKLGKNVIAVPRLSKFGEHIDDHQLQIVSILEEKGYVRTVYEIENLDAVINKALTNPISKPYDRESYVLDIIEEKIDYWFGEK